MAGSKVRPSPCQACPYRRDVPSGVWAAHEYDKLIGYDTPTGEQPIAVFACHATPEAICHGWAVVHNNRGSERELLALRVVAVDGEIPTESPVELFSSGAEAAEHGKRDVEHPSQEACEIVERLIRKYERLTLE